MRRSQLPDRSWPGGGMGWRSAVVALVILGASVAFGFTVDEIRELQQLGFTNEQIVALQAGQAGLPGDGVPGDSQSAGIDLARIKALQDRGEGLLVVCFTKEWVQRGPGFLYLDRKAPGGGWVPVGKVPLLDCTSTGQFGPPRIEHIQEVVKPCGRGDRERDRPRKGDQKPDGHGSGPGRVERVIEKTIVHPRLMMASRYHAEFALPAGEYEIRFERKFFTGDNEESGPFKSRRARTLWSVPIVAGRVTLASYCWGPNETFGKDHGESYSHLAWLEELSRRLGPLLTTVKR